MSSIDIMAMQSWFVLEQISESSENLQEAHLAYVKGEEVDEDGDWAMEFILADPIPNNVDPHLSERAMTSSGKGSCWSNSYGTCKTSLVDMLTCHSCYQEVPIQEIFSELNCSCLCCKACLADHVERYLFLEMRNDKKIESEMNLRAFSCPACSLEDSISLSAVQVLAPDTFREWQEHKDELLFGTDSFVRCPGCGIVIEKLPADIPPGVAPSVVPELDRTAPFLQVDDNGKAMSRAALFDKAVNYFRCASCNVCFCSVCLVIPYHLGKSCKESEVERKAVKCRYCQLPISSSNDSENFEPNMKSVRELRCELNDEGLDTAWCVEKKDLIAIRCLADSVCEDKKCRKRLRQGCTRKLECGHHCGGISGELRCLPCLEESCRKQAMLQSEGGKFLPDRGEFCSICWTESLCDAPSIQLQCGHIVHYKCAKKKLKQSFPGPEISFGYLNCPQCPSIMHHGSLSALLQKPLKLMNVVKENAVKRLKLDKSDEPIKPEEVEARALRIYQYYICNKCENPYFGGKRNCAMNEENEKPHDPKELICGGCSAAVSPENKCTKGHGKEFIEFKCRFCCSIATYFCFGKVHFCERCHTTRPDVHASKVPEECKGAKWCALGVTHPPAGNEFCLGCSMCRLLSQ